VGKGLEASCGFCEPAFLRDFTQLRGLLALDPFKSVDRSQVYDCYVTFLHHDAVIPADAAMVSQRGDVEVIRLTESEAFCVARKLGSSPGSPNAFMEKVLGLPATTRAWNTVVRLLAKHG
jgi:uncharacterized protein (DUF1697 family)